MIKFKVFIPMLLVLAVSSTVKAQDIVIIGDTPEKQAETQQQWGRLKQPTQRSRPGISQEADYETVNRCKRERNNRHSIYNTFDECLKAEVQARNLYQSPEYQQAIRSVLERGEIGKCYSMVGIDGSWVHRLACLQNAVEAKQRQRDYYEQ